MAPSEKQPFYDPIPPTYDEATAGSSSHGDVWHRSESPARNEAGGEHESQSLLNRSNGASSSSRRPHGYQPPTVESDDDSDLDSLLESGSEAEEAEQVRREIEEMDVEEPGGSGNTLWGKRIPFSLSLPRWKWSWRPRLPTMPRMRVFLPQRPPEEDSGANTNNNTGEDSTANEGDANATRRRFVLPKVNGMIALIIFARLLAVFMIMGFVYLVFASDLFGSFNNRLSAGMRFNAEDLRIHVLDSVDPMRLRASVQHFSSYAHIAGTEGDYATAMDVETMFGRAGLDEASVDEYHVYINYPRKDGRAIQIMEGDKAIWTADLEETDPGTETAGRSTYAFHGHSKSGDVKGPLIYANYGSRDDFKKLKDQGIETKDAIALVRYYGTQEDGALKVKAAEMAGFAGCIIYSDPAEDGFVKGEVAPKGRYMPADGVQRGSVSLSSWVVGDVLTPGWESKSDMPRMKREQTPGLVKIPSLPLSWKNAQVLLQHLKGYGQKVDDDWEGGVPEVDEWWTGNSTSPIVRLKNKQDENDKQAIWNVYGRIEGMEQTAKTILIGNHRDAWAWGATDPHSGTAVMIELARIFGDLLLRGWRPLRTIEFMSWDAEAYNFIGSTEYVENNLDSLRENALAYINLDSAVSGTEFHAAGSPALQRTLLRAMGRLEDPIRNTTLKELWDQRSGELEGLGSGGDYLAFQDIAGTSSIDLEFRGEMYPHHSSYDNFDLVEQHIDPEFAYHGLMTQLVALIILDLADKAVMPFDMVAYGDRLERWVNDLAKWAGNKEGEASKLSFQGMTDAVSLIKKNAMEFARWESEWDQVISNSGGWEDGAMGAKRVEYNSKMGEFESALLDLELGGGVSVLSFLS